MRPRFNSFKVTNTSDNTFDNFKLDDIAGPFDAGARWFSTLADVQIDESDDNVLTPEGRKRGQAPRSGRC